MATCDSMGCHAPLVVSRGSTRVVFHTIAANENCESCDFISLLLKYFYPNCSDSNDPYKSAQLHNCLDLSCLFGFPVVG